MIAGLPIAEVDKAGADAEDFRHQPGSEHVRGRSVGNRLSLGKDNGPVRVLEGEVEVVQNRDDKPSFPRPSTGELERSVLVLEIKMVGWLIKEEGALLRLPRR